MKENKLLLVAGAFLTFAGIISSTAYADQSYPRVQGQFVVVSGEASGEVPLFSNGSEVAAIISASRENLNKDALVACSGGDFRIDPSSIRYASSSKRLNGDSNLFSMRTLAMALCLN